MCRFDISEQTVRISISKDRERLCTARSMTGFAAFELSANVAGNKPLRGKTIEQVGRFVRPPGNEAGCRVSCLMRCRPRRDSMVCGGGSR